MLQETKAPQKRITLDTNVCDIVHNPSKRPQIIDPVAARLLRQAIASKNVLAFVSEASLFVECLSFKEKLTYLSVAGTTKPRPSPDPRRTAVFTDLASLGVRLLRAPLISAEIFIKDLDWAEDAVHDRSERQRRFDAFLAIHPRHRPLKVIGERIMKNPDRSVPASRISRRTPNGFSVEVPLTWANAIKQEWDASDEAEKKALRKEVGRVIGEWCDALIVASHSAYGNDVLCTADEGKGAGSGSILHHLNRANLAQQGVMIMSPAELAASLSQ
jgi:hypothetical protein